MCDDRERLIGYVYDECDADERRAIETHLEECRSCRNEIGGFRRVRQDLLAWDVPEHDSVWRPFAPAPPVQPWWRQVPAWAMAAAATAMFAIGAGGGLATHALLAHEAVTVAAVPPATATPAVTAEDLNAFETRMVGLVQSEIATRPVPAGLENVAMTAQERDAFEAEMMQRVKALQTEHAKLSEWWRVLASDLGSQANRLNRVRADVDNLYQNVGNPGR